MNKSEDRHGPKSRKGISLQASKWIALPALIDCPEMEELFKGLGKFQIFQVSEITPLGGGEIPHAAFLDAYSRYIECLKSGRTPPNALYRHFFSGVLTADLDALYTIDLGDGRQLIKPVLPVIQMQSHRLGYSEVDGKFRSMVFGEESILWGVQFSYPQLFQDPQSLQVLKVAELPSFLNNELFRKLRSWVRHHTIAAPFIARGRKENVPVRLGKRCLGWINIHPQLIQKGLQIRT